MEGSSFSHVGLAPAQCCALEDEPVCFALFNLSHLLLELRGDVS